MSNHQLYNPSAVSVEHDNKDDFAELAIFAYVTLVAVAAMTAFATAYGPLIGIN